MDALTSAGVNLAKNWFNYGENVKLLQKNLGELTCRADDIEEQVKMAESSCKKKRKREVANWLENVKKMKEDFIALQNRVNEEGFWKNPMSGEHVLEMLEPVAALTEQSQSHHFCELVLDARENKGRSRLTSRLFGEMFEVNLEKIKKNLMPHSNIKRIGIYGMGGVGKTTVAKHINNHLLEIPNFHVCWLTVSQELSIRKLQDGIARFFNLRLSDDDDEEQRAYILSKELKQTKKFVLILDDVWSFLRLEKLGISLEAEHWLILTSRSSKLCHQLLCQEIIQVKPLQADEAWGLFEDTLGYQTTLQADVETVAKKIVKRCGGLPLGIITMAGSMRGVEDVAEWRDALNKLKQLSVGHDDMEHEVFPVLQWSINRLNKCHQCCLFCCSLYPEDYVIPIDEIISRFISLDLMDRRDTRRQEYDQSHVILNNLINSCLLEKATDYKRVEGVRMHDLIRDVVLRFISGNSLYNDIWMPRYMVKSGMGLREVPSEREWAKDLDIVSLMDNHISEISPVTSPQCSNLSVLILQKNYLKSIPDFFFDRFKTQLKILDLSWTSIKELPNCISDMVNLNALILTNCGGLKFLPPLGKLKNLRELNLQRTSIDKIPVGLEALVNLKYLNMITCVNKAFQQITEGTFSKLHYLQYLRVLCAIEIEELEGLKHLEIFEGYLSDLDSYDKLVKSRHVFLWLDCYCIYVGNIQRQFPRNTQCDHKELIFENCNFGNRGRGVNLVLLPQDIEILEIGDCFGMSTCLADTIQLKTLNNLSKLVINRLPKVEFLLRLSTLGGHSFLLRALLELHIEHLPELIGLVRREDLEALGNLSHGTFSCLREFSIRGCDRIKKLFPVWLFQNLQNLEEIYVRECYKLEEIIAEDDDAVGSNSTSSGTISVTLPKLKILRLIYLPQLRSICDGTLFCDSIERFEIIDCPKLEMLPLNLPTTVNGEPSLQRGLEHILGNDKWWKDLGALRNLSRGTFSCLRKFVIQRCDRIKKLFPVWLLQNLQNLEEAYIIACDKLEEIIAEDHDAGRPNSTSSVTLPK